MTRALLALIALGFCSCATPHAAPRFDKPSTQPIAKAHKTAIASVKSAIQKADSLAKEKAVSENPTLKLQVVELHAKLDDALRFLNMAEGARVALDSQLVTQTKRANTLADSFDKAQLHIASVEASRHRWVKYALYAAGLALLEGAWICRKPILMLIASGGL